MTPILAFDIETVPDVAGLRLLHGIDPKLGDRDVAEFAFRERRANTGQDFLPLHLHRVAAIACALREGDTFRCWSLGSADDGEGELIRRFFDGIERYTPQLVSWNGGGFDLPVLHYRSLVHGVSAPRYWDTGDDDREFRFNNYLSRYHSRHLDLMDVLAAYQGRAYVPLDELARLLRSDELNTLYGAQLMDQLVEYEGSAILQSYQKVPAYQSLMKVLIPYLKEAKATQ